MIIKGNYHIHTEKWSDGESTLEEIIQKAIDAELNEIGITDHYYTKKGVPKYVDDTGIDEYLQEIEEWNRKSKNIRILAGLEIDTRPDKNLKITSLPFDKLNRLDYVLFEYVENGGYSLPKLIELRKNLTCEVGLAHPNIKKNFSHYKPEELARMLKENNIFLDACCATGRNVTYEKYDGRYSKPYFCGLGEEFKAAFKKFRVKFAPSTDYHYRDDPLKTDMAYEKIGEYGFSQKHFKKKHAPQRV